LKTSGCDVAELLNSNMPAAPEGNNDNYRTVQQDYRSRIQTIAC
jgi:hypothetical protein